MKYNNIDRLKFSITISPYMDHSILKSKLLIEKLSKLKNRIYDINFTARVDPFFEDAHGIIISKPKADLHLKAMLQLQNDTEVRISALFNNIYVSPTLEKLDQFIKNFKNLYESGIRSITIPHSLWLYNGALQDTFPGLSIKNTVLRRTRNAQDFYNFADAGFDYVNLDRLLCRDLKMLKQIKKAQNKFCRENGKYVYTSMLVGEGCQGDCPFWEEHYQHNISVAKCERHAEDQNSKIKIKKNFPRNITKCDENISTFSRTLPTPFKSDLDKIVKNIDIIKIAGRHNEDIIINNLEIINKFFIESDHDLNIAIAEWYSPFDLTKIEKISILKWKEKVTTCGFQCWNCSICEDTQINILKSSKSIFYNNIENKYNKS